MLFLLMNNDHVFGKSKAFSFYRIKHLKIIINRYKSYECVCSCVSLNLMIHLAFHVVDYVLFWNILFPLSASYPLFKYKMINSAVPMLVF